ncbi:ubiquinol-cytochrome c reductase [Terasakiella brassicae]|uniref:Ubiquinol-cytochrome c reductase n=1 Tax=Terasakiella brassicae TaxID=1634917 RepID=A0A917BY59_9PROT|nr:EVE domain-containing protein [Terasakiella brassicae]GGF59391.1 ubiquinol-cytochrome c reductase [Terasakiella brassicae]
MNYWLVKSEPGCWSWADHVQKGVEPWDGVRNFQAAKYMKAMEVGDLAFFYHSQKEKAVVGVLEVVTTAYPDPSDESGRFVCVDFKALHPLKHPVSLKQIKDDPRLADMALVKQARLSVLPVAPDAWALINALGGVEE